MNEFHALYQCTFQPSERDQQLRSVAERYVQESEAYDRTVCTGPIRHGWVMPGTSHEHALISRNAQQLMDALCREHCGTFTRAEIRLAVAKCELHP
ncbi:hypothetical protein [Pseudomonas leptonychotis]|uniref:hypothetical protein n=1 Tax=Pseudomonas leptonychotis TaxID=2448482 RepID=UPI00142D6827|nr:hypothetical protein [Pseudomonas leptonychotis]